MPCQNMLGTRGLACSKKMGGLESIFITSSQNVTATSSDSGAYGTITAMTVTTANTGSFQEIKLVQETSTFSFNPTVNKTAQSLFYDTKCTFVLFGYDATVREIVSRIANTPCDVVVKTASGEYFYLPNLDLESGEGSVGTAAGDRNGVSLTLSSKSQSAPKQVASSVITTPNFTFA